MLNTGLFIVLGLVAGVVSGMIGIGGGIIIVPALVFLFGFSQHTAQGTTLALLVLPIGILAALEYHKQGYVDIRVGVLIAAGFLVGGLLGAKFATALSDITLARIFGVALILIGGKMLIA